MAQRYLWILDAGHAPATPGKRSPVLDDGSRFYEWHAARVVVDLIAQGLDAKGLAYHVLTPRTDWDMPAAGRAQLANWVARRVAPSGLQCRAVSVHMNAFGNGSALLPPKGATVLYRNHKGMAERLLAKIVSHTELDDRGPKMRADLGFLNKTNMPAVLSESGFYTNEQDLQLLLSLAGLRLIAQAHVDFILDEEGR